MGASAELVHGSTMAAQADPWRFTPHPEVWVLVGGLALLYWYAITRIGPTATRPDEPVVTASQVRWFVAGLVLLWVASDWPVHDIAEGYLYSVHMVQHLLLSLVIPPMVLLATPTWLARMVVGSGVPYRVLRFLTRPVTATLIFNAVVAATHIPGVVNASASSAPLHYLVHVVVVAAALIMWTPVAGPLPELRFTLPVQMIFLFMQSIIPTVPAGWLTFAEGVVYKAYDVPTRLAGMSVAHDQQLAGLVMKTVGGFYLWFVIAMLFIRFATKQQEDDRAGGMPLDRRAPVATAAGTLTWEEVERQLKTAPPAPTDPVDRPTS
ncbi:MAG TPA: cytochrome c oxidase assembly protein [Acidimicrobiales bacterium]|nr:cytochrome c oxidase assembly protein [Acidimicrobiales bacterium]